MSCGECGSTDWRVTDDNGVTDPANGDRIEYCECQQCGHEWTNVLRA